MNTSISRNKFNLFVFLKITWFVENGNILTYIIPRLMVYLQIRRQIPEEEGGGGGGRGRGRGEGGGVLMGEWTFCLELKLLRFNRSSRQVLLRMRMVKTDRKMMHLRAMESTNGTS